MSEFKRGQRVWAFTYGWGVVEEVNIDDCLDYPVMAKFSEEVELHFTLDGRYTTEENRTLFFKEIPIPEDALIPPVDEITLNTGDIVVFNNGGLGYVELYSGPESKTFRFHNKVPQTLDEAFDPVAGYKKSVKKVIGNING